MAIFDELKSVGKILQEAGKIEQYKQILDALQKLLEMQKRIDELETENKKLKEKLETKESLHFENGAYWITKEDSTKDGPFCSRCWDVEKNTVRLKPGINPAFHSCPECKGQFQTNPGYRPAYTPRNPPISFV